MIRDYFLSDDASYLRRKSTNSLNLLRSLTYCKQGARRFENWILKSYWFHASDSKMNWRLTGMMRKFPIRISLYLLLSLFIAQTSVFLEQYVLKGIGYGHHRSKITESGITHGSRSIIQTNLNQRFFQNEKNPVFQFRVLAPLSSKAEVLPNECSNFNPCFLSSPDTPPGPQRRVLRI